MFFSFYQRKFTTLVVAIKINIIKNAPDSKARSIGIEVCNLLFLFFMLVERRTWTTFAIAMTFATILTLTTLRAFTTLWTRTTFWTLLITLWLRQQYLVRELELASFRINVQQLHLNLVTFLDASFFYSLQTFPVDLRDMEQKLASRKVTRFK